MSITVYQWFLVERSAIEFYRMQYLSKDWILDDTMIAAAEDAVSNRKKAMSGSWQDSNLRWGEASQCLWFEKWDMRLPPTAWVEPIMTAVAKEIFGYYLDPSERQICDRTIAQAMVKESLRQGFELIADARPEDSQAMSGDRTGSQRLLAALDVMPAGPFLPITHDDAIPFGWPLIDLRKDFSESRAVAVAIPIIA